MIRLDDMECFDEVTREVNAHRRDSKFDIDDSESLSWICVSCMLQPQPLRLTLQVKIIDWTFGFIVVEPNSYKTNCAENRLLRLALSHQTNQCEALNASNDVQEVLTSCRELYRHDLPSFPTVLWLRTERKQFQIIEEIDNSILDLLQSSQDLFGQTADAIPKIPGEELTTIARSGCYFLPNTRLVLYQGQEFVAKGQVYASRVQYDFDEVRNLLALSSQHRNIMPKPSGLVVVSETDDRVCGFLTPFLRKGNMDVYAQKLRDSGRLSSAVLCRWFKQLVMAVKFLAEQGTWHGDIKPDNVLIDDEENAVLIDLARTFATSATASPEVKAYYVERLNDSSSPTQSFSGDQITTTTEIVQFGIPKCWSLTQIMASEVYSIGRTMYLVTEAISMLDIYDRYGWIDIEVEFMSKFDSNSETPDILQRLILQCLTPEAEKRISLDELHQSLEGIEFSS